MEFIATDFNTKILTSFIETKKTGTIFPTAVQYNYMQEV